MPGLGLALGLDFLDAGTRVRDNAFRITVDTTQAGSASDTFVLPLVSGESYDFEVDWGDGNVESVSGSSLSSKSHTYSSGGTYQIAITGTFPRIYFNNGGDKLKLSSIDNWGDIVWSSMFSAFYGCSNMVGTYTDSPNTYSVTNMQDMFRSCSSFNSPVNFDTSSVTTMRDMFFGCSSFNQSVSSFDTSLVTTMRGMFLDCSSFNSPVNFDTSSVTNMFQMFRACSSFNSPVNFDTSSVTDMFRMFRDCSSFNQSVSSFDTSSVTNMSSMFSGCFSFKQSLATFDMTSVANVTDMLLNCDINEAGTTTNYDNTLIAWELQDLVDGLNFNGGTSKYSSTGETARDAIINDDSWVITDGGIAEGILDLYTGAAAAYSLRQLATGSQTVVRVRRSSDNAEDDFTATEVVDGTLENWVNTGVVQYTSDFTSGNEDLSEIRGTGTDGETVAGVSDAYKFTLTDGLNSHQAFTTTFEANQAHTLTFDFYIPSSNTSVDGIKVIDNLGTNIYSNSITDQWTSVSLSHTFTSNHAFFFRPTDGVIDSVNADGDVFYLKNIVVTQTTADGHVTTWYDQAGSNDATQATASAQPKIVSGGSMITRNGSAAIQADGVDDIMSTASSILSTDFSVFAVAGNNDLSNANFVMASQYSSSGSSGRTIFYTSRTLNSIQVAIQIGTYYSITGVPTSDHHLYYYNRGGSNLDFAIDGGTASNQTNSNAIDNEPLDLFAIPNISSYSENFIKELIIFNSDQSTNRSGIEGNINNHYNIYP